MTQPTFAPVSRAAEVSPTMASATPEIGRALKKGLERSARPTTGRGRGTPAPDAGYALGIARREVAALDFERPADRHDVELGVALVAAKRAGAIGRAPILSDVRAVMEHFGLRSGAVVDAVRSRPFVGLAHSYVAQRALVDGVDLADLTRDAVAD